MTKIEWTEATWNPIVGCSVVSPGCANCYAMRVAHRLGKNNKTPHYAGLTQVSRGGPVWTGKVALAPEHVLTAPLRRRKPTTYFVNSMGDLFHEDAPDEWIDRVFAVMALCPQHRFQVLTKRAGRMRQYVSRLPNRQEGEPSWPVNPLETIAHDVFEDLGFDGDPASTRAFEAVQDWPLPNVWLGVSAEDQTRADERIPDLLATPAAVRFVSAEPSLGPVRLRSLTATRGSIRPYRAILDALDGSCQSRDHATSDWFSLPARLDWVICGGESGRGARPMHPDWARALRDQCVGAGVAFFFKQWGAWAPGENCDHIPTRSEHVAWWWNDSWTYDCLSPRASEEMHRDEAPDLYLIGKARSGRLLDGREWNQMPETPDA